MISQCAAISSNLGFQFCQLVVIEWPGNLVVQLGREHFLMSQKHSNSFWKSLPARKLILSSESTIDGIAMQNEGIKQEGVMALFAEGAVVNGKWAHTSPPNQPICQLSPKTIQLFPRPGPLVKQTLHFGNLYHLITASTCHSKSRQSVH